MQVKCYGFNKIVVLFGTKFQWQLQMRCYLEKQIFDKHNSILTPLNKYQVSIIDKVPWRIDEEYSI